jgi:hypothetical protein
MVYAGISKTVQNRESPLVSEVSTGVTWSATSPLQVRATVSGSGTTTLRIKVWRTGQSEPSAWASSASDATPALQDSGALALLAYGASNGRDVMLRFDDWTVTRT